MLASTGDSREPKFAEWLDEINLLQIQARLYLFSMPSEEELKKHEEIDSKVFAMQQAIDYELDYFNSSDDNVENGLLDFQIKKIKEQQFTLNVLLKFNSAIYLHKLSRYKESGKIIDGLLKYFDPGEGKLGIKICIGLLNLSAKSLRAQGNISECIEKYKKALSFFDREISSIEDSRNKATIESSLAYALNDLGDDYFPYRQYRHLAHEYYDEALRHHEVAYFLNPQSHIIKSNYAHGICSISNFSPYLLTRDLENLEYALSLLNESIAEQEISSTYYDRALVHEKLGKEHEMMSDLKQAGDKDHVKALVKLAECYFNKSNISNSHNFIDKTKTLLNLKEKSLRSRGLELSKDFNDIMRRIEFLENRIVHSERPTSPNRVSNNQGCLFFHHVDPVPHSFAGCTDISAGMLNITHCIER